MLTISISYYDFGLFFSISIYTIPSFLTIDRNKNYSEQVFSSLQRSKWARFSLKGARRPTDPIFGRAGSVQIRTVGVRRPDRAIPDVRGFGIPNLIQM